MIPARRLLVLLQQAVQLQTQRCLYRSLAVVGAGGETEGAAGIDPDPLRGGLPWAAAGASLDSITLLHDHVCARSAMRLLSR